MSSEKLRDFDEPPPDYEDAVSDPKPSAASDVKERALTPEPELDSDSDVSTDAKVGLINGKNKSLHIDALGVNAAIIPHAAKQLVTQVTNADGSSAYTSTRFKHGSGDCVLSSPQGELISTRYRFGPGRDPELSYVQPSPSFYSDNKTISVKSRWMTRTASFEAPDGRTFEWYYAKDKTTRSNLIVLSESSAAAKGAKGEHPHPTLAKLVRNESTRPEGSSKRSAGNGGMLVIADGAWRVIDEPLLVATCLVMLKREIDRRRAAQISSFAGAASAG